VWSTGVVAQFADARVQGVLDEQVTGEDQQRAAEKEHPAVQQGDLDPNGRAAAHHGTR